MLVTVLNPLVLNETLIRMTKKEECVSIQDVEEGEISDSGSVEEISEKDFTGVEEATNKVSTNSDPKPRVWTMQDLYKYQNKYQMSGGYASGLYNLAWAQAVQNKPLDEYLVMEFKNSENSNPKCLVSSNSVDDNNKNSNGGSLTDNTTEEGSKVVIEVDDVTQMEEAEKEDGELEEGEIDLYSEVPGEAGLNNNVLCANKSDIDVNWNVETEERLNLIGQELETVTVNDAVKSFDGVCSRMQKLLDSLGEMTSENSVSNKAALVQKSFSAIQTVNCVFCSMSQNQKEQNRDTLLRLLVHITSQNPPLFSSEQMKEIEVMIPFLGSLDISLNSEDIVTEKVLQIAERVNQNEYDVSAHIGYENVNSLKKCVLDSVSVESSEQNVPYIMLESLKTGVASYKGRGALLPLLDLHKDHDAESLPSPTRETPPLLPIERALAFGDGVVKPEWSVPRPALDTQSTVVQSYETDALKAVSTYQQKFGRNSFLMTNRLPSPTPSEESDNGEVDTGGEVSSSSILGNVNPINAPNLSKTIVSSVPHMDISSEQGLMNARNATPLSSGSITEVRGSVRSRDPRIRFANSSAAVMDLNQNILPVSNNEPTVVPLGEMISSRKQKIVQESALDGPALKRQRNELSDFGAARYVESVSGFGGWLEDRGTVGLQVTSKDWLVENKGIQPRKFENALSCSGTTSSTPNIVTNEKEHLPVTGATTTASLNSLLKDIAVNPAMWMNIFKMEQQKIVVPAEVTNQTQSSISILGAVPIMNIPSPKNPTFEQRSAGILQTPQTASSDEFGKLRMKPRDPRRALQSNSSHKGGNLGSDQSKTKTLSMQGMGNLNVQKQEDQLVKKNISSQSTSPPDIARQFTKNLKNIADIMSVTQASMTLPAVPQISSSQPAQVHPSWVDLKGVLTESGNLQSETGLASEDVIAGPSQSPNNWGDVEHLFEGFDDQQKADIQRERARRIEEQKKMFATHKLCLVLDLDHTLLNSAKFVEIDPMHDELLRKKEEQDREKPQRHLFRFPHMGMWTKLRPGIWNFLEKASKLFEMHLYTMGNKLYATEMAKVLDPKGILFAGRVISKGDDGDLIDGDDRVPKTKDLEGVLGMESAVVIIDDSLRVWPHNKLNLIVVERYIFFPCSRRQFGLPGPSLLEIDHDERSENGTLASSLGVIERIHQNFFSHRSLDEADVRNILAAEQHKILGGCRIVFSRVFPVGEANPQLHPLWQTAEQFGAVCINQIDEQVTHVVANSLGTDKVNWALSTGRFVVHPGWVEASALLYRRANEHDFAVKP